MLLIFLFLVNSEQSEQIKMFLKIVFIVCTVSIVLVMCKPAADKPNYKEIEVEVLETDIEEGGKYHYR